MHAFFLVLVVTWQYIHHSFWRGRNVFLLWNDSVKQGMKYNRKDHDAVERSGDGDERDEYVVISCPPPRRKNEEST
jgi:hypothetical protein